MVHSPDNSPIRTGRGRPEDELLRGQPRLTREHLRAAWSRAADVIGLEQTHLGQARPMRFLADEILPVDLVLWLRARGW